MLAIRVPHIEVDIFLYGIYLRTQLRIYWHFYLVFSLSALRSSQTHLKWAFIMPIIQEGQLWRPGLMKEQLMLATAMKWGAYFALADLSLRFADRSLSFAGAAEIRVCFRLPSARPGS